MWKSAYVDVYQLLKCKHQCFNQENYSPIPHTLKTKVFPVLAMKAYGLGATEV